MSYELYILLQHTTIITSMLVFGILIVDPKSLQKFKPFLYGLIVILLITGASCYLALHTSFSKSLPWQHNFIFSFTWPLLIIIFIPTLIPNSNKIKKSSPRRKLIFCATLLIGLTLYSVAFLELIT